MHSMQPNNSLNSTTVALYRFIFMKCISLKSEHIYVKNIKYFSSETLSGDLIALALLLRQTPSVDSRIALCEHIHSMLYSLIRQF